MYPLREAFGKGERMPEHDPTLHGATLTGHFVEDIGADLRYSGRIMRKNPLFTLFAVVTLALGIGGNATAFTIINTLVLKPLPIGDQSQLAAIIMTETKSGKRSNVAAATLVRRSQRLSEPERRIQLAWGIHLSAHCDLAAPGGSQRMFGELVTGNYFSTLAIFGRFFLPALLVLGLIANRLLFENTGSFGRTYPRPSDGLHPRAAGGHFLRAFRRHTRSRTRQNRLFNQFI